MRECRAPLPHLDLRDIHLLSEVTEVCTTLHVLWRPKESEIPGLCSTCFEQGDDERELEELDAPENCHACGALMAYIPTHGGFQRILAWLYRLVKQDIPLPHQAWWDLWMGMRVLPDHDDSWDLVSYVVTKGKRIDPALRET